MIVVHRSERADLLVEALGDLLLDTLDNPMAAEVVAVPSRGVERWLTQRLSHRLGASAGGDGICANVDFPFPGSVVGEATSLACGFDPESDPWPPERSVWPLLDLVDEHLAAPWLAPLAAHLAAGSPAGVDGPADMRRFTMVRHLADLFDRYGVHRPDMILGWAKEWDAADDRLFYDWSDAGRDDHWQAALWRRLRRRLGVPSPAERLALAVESLSARPELLELPPRLSLFGLTRLPASHLRIFEAIGRGRDVHLFALHPSGVLWDAVDGALAGGPVRSASSVRSSGAVRRSEDATAGLVRNPLLGSWGRDAREMQLVLRARGAVGGEHLAVPEPAGDLSLLQLLQADVRLDRPPPGAPRAGGDERRPVLHPDDDSLRVHSCHGRLRQVEVMRDAVLHLLADDPTLEPRDVIVMCPDIDAFAPLIHAVFGAGVARAGTGAGDALAEGIPGPPPLRVRLADRSIRQTNPVLAVAAQLLELAAGRVAASEVLDLAGREPVARRFGLDEDDLAQIERWVGVSGIRWGFDQQHRAPWQLEQVGENTWQSGLDRLLLGVAMAEEDQRLFHGVLPVDDMSSGAVDLAGRFAELVDRLQAAVDQLQGRHDVGEWMGAIARATESLAEPAAHEQWQREQLHWVLRDVAASADARSAEEPGGASSALLDLAEVRSLMDDRLRGRPTRANFRTGDLTICTLVPMRSVPHRVVGLLGLDDGAFPRAASFDGDDLLLADPHVGDRDGRSEDRQLLLDALLAATEHLVVTYEGHDPRTNEGRAPCVPLAELLDVVDRTVVGSTSPGSPPHRARRQVVVEHPLQSFDARNFIPGQLGADPSWSFDPVDLAGARAHGAPPGPARPFLSASLPALDDQFVQLDSLVRFLDHPVRAFLRERLGWYANWTNDSVRDGLPVELDSLERWAVGNRLLDALLAGATLAGAREAELRRGLLPPGQLAVRLLDDVEQAVGSLADAARQETEAAPDGPGSIEVLVRLHDGRALVGTVPDVFSLGPSGVPGAGLHMVRCVYSQLGAKQRLAAWARFLALTAGHPERTVSAVTIGRNTRSSGRASVALTRLAPLGDTPVSRRERALAELGVLVDLYDRGMREPLPLYAKTSERYASAVKNQGDARSDADRTWKSDAFNFGEAGDTEHLLVFGGVVPIDHLLQPDPAAQDETGPGWGRDPSRFGRLARRLWEPLHEHEQREYRS